MPRIRKRSGRVNILAVSKGQIPDAIREAYRVGQNNFGENYVQEAKKKIDHVSKANWHFIGAIQSNKTKEIAKILTGSTLLIVKS